MQNSRVLPRGKYFLSVEAMLCQSPNLIPSTPESELALPGNPQQKIQILRGFSVQWESIQGPKLVIDWFKCPARPVHRLPGMGVCRTHTSVCRLRTGLFVKVLLRMNLRGWTGVATWKRRERDIIKTGAWHTQAASPHHVWVERRMFKESKHWSWFHHGSKAFWPAFLRSYSDTEVENRLETIRIE